MVPGTKNRIAFSVHYDGAAFYGWQFLPDHPSVQATIEGVLGRLFEEPVRIAGSGRTDRGVHATGQVAIVDAPERWTASELRRAMNALLPQTVWISHAQHVADDFHPRFNAIARSYRYRVGFVENASSPFLSRWCWPLGYSLDLSLLNQAVAPIPGTHSFRAFAKAGQEHRGERCIVQSAEWVSWGDTGAEFRITSNRFLHHMVRYLVGTAIDIGRERRPVEDLGRLIETPDELETSPPAPPEGLYLSRVDYADGAYLGPEHRAEAHHESNSEK